MDETQDNIIEHPTEDNTVTKLVDWKNPPKLSDLKKDFIEAKSDTDRHVHDVERWLDNLNVENRAVPKVQKGKSKVQPKVIRKQAEWRYPALSEPFLSTEDVFNVSPVTYLDTKAAKQNQMILNNQFNTKIKKVNFIDTLVRTLVDEGTAIVRVGWEYEEEIVTEQVPEYELIQSLDPLVAEMHQELVDIRRTDMIKYESEVPEELKLAHMRSMDEGIAYRPQETGVVNEVERTKIIKNNPTVEVCDYRNISIDPNCKGDIDKAKFVIFSFTTSLSELKKEGIYTNLDRVNVNTNSVLGEPDHQDDNQSFQFSDKPRQNIVAYEYWGYWDIDGSGETKPFVATWVGDTLIRLEENPFPDQALPFVIIPYLPKRKSCFGEPDGELLEENQKIIGAVTRGMIDVMARSANGQTGARKDALDITNWRRYQNGEDYEFNPNVDPRQAFHMHTYPEIPNSAPLMLSMQNADAESLTGVKAFSAGQGISGTELGDSVGGIKSALDATAKRELGILRRLAEGVKQIGRKFISMNAEFLSEEEVVRITDEEFVSVKRDDLAGNFDLKLSISTAEADQQKAQELAFMLQTMGPNEDPQVRKMILTEIALLRKMPDLAKKIEQYEPQPDPIEQQRRVLELELLKAQIMKEQSITKENHAEANLDLAKANTEAAKAGNIISDTDMKNLDYIEQESGVKQERELQKASEQSRGNMALEITKTALANTNSTEGQLP